MAESLVNQPTMKRMLACGSLPATASISPVREPPAALRSGSGDPSAVEKDALDAASPVNQLTVKHTLSGRSLQHPLLAMAPSLGPMAEMTQLPSPVLPLPLMHSLGLMAQPRTSVMNL